MTITTAVQYNHPAARELPILTIRPIRPDDDTLIYEMHKRLSAESLYFRYLQCKIPSWQDLAAVCNLPAEKGEAFVVISNNDDARIIGLAYYVRESTAYLPTAEVGILIEDFFQGQGIGRMLWQALHQSAQAKQIRRLRVLFDPSNHRMLRLIKGSGYSYEVSAEGELNDFMISLDEDLSKPWAQQLLEKFGLPILQRLFRYRETVSEHVQKQTATSMSQTQHFTATHKLLE
ncbi:MAG: GNAT family N-acetyltransferase [Caldilineaceae bacterium]